MSDESKPHRSTKDLNIKNSSPIHLEIDNDDETISYINSNSNDERSNYQKSTTSYERKKKKARQSVPSTNNAKYSVHDVRKASRHLSVSKSVPRMNKEYIEDYEVEDFEESHVLTNQKQSDEEDCDENYPLTYAPRKLNTSRQHQMKPRGNSNQRQAKENKHNKSLQNVANSSASLQINSAFNNETSGYQTGKMLKRSLKSID